MGRFIIKLDQYYLEWSTVVDAPVTFGMSLSEFKEYYRRTYGLYDEDAEDRFQQRMARVAAKGTSALNYESAEEVIQGNRAGRNETCLTKEQIIQAYCIDKIEQGKDLPLGVDFFADS